MKLKKSKPLSILVAALMLAAMLIISVATARPKQKPAAADTAATVSQASDSTPDETRDDMRGIWVTYMELSMEYESDQSEAAFRRKFEAIAEDCKVSGFNTLIVQVRPFCDALYQSKLFPASHVLSGEQGKSLGYDPLRIMCAICQKRGLRLHAWVNPYRVTVNQTPAQLSDNNPYVKDPSLGIETESGIILDPSNERARQLIVDGVREIVENYAVDGIQFDDYFYPTDIENLDHAQYQAYAATVKEGEPMDLAQWRRENVNLLLAQVYLAVQRKTSCSACRRRATCKITRCCTPTSCAGVKSRAMSITSARRSISAPTTPPWALRPPSTSGRRWTSPTACGCMSAWRGIRRAATRTRAHGSERMTCSRPN